jgi:hypothetical protein
MDGFETVLNELNKLSRAAARYMKPYWGLQVSHDIKKPDVLFSIDHRCYSDSEMNLFEPSVCAAYHSHNHHHHHFVTIIIIIITVTSS